MDKQGLYQKYSVTKTDGTPVDPDAQYFVLRLDTDRNARLAALEYARQLYDEVEEGESLAFPRDIVQRVLEIDPDLAAWCPACDGDGLEVISIDAVNKDGIEIPCQLCR